MKQPMQPLVRDEHGTIRFQANAIVRYLLDEATAGRRCSMNDLARHQHLFSADDREQFAQLIGYSVSGYGDLSYVRDESYDAAHAAAQELLKP